MIYLWVFKFYAMAAFWLCIIVFVPLVYILIFKGLRKWITRIFKDIHSIKEK